MLRNIEIQDGYFTGIAVDAIVTLTTELLDNSKFKTQYINSCKESIHEGKKYNYEYYINIVNQIPDTLAAERGKIITFFENIKDEIGLDTQEG